MKLQRVRSRRLPREYWKFQVVLPNDVVQKLGWQGNEELEATTKGRDGIMLREVRVESTNNCSPKASYEECLNHVRDMLRLNPSGVSWIGIWEKHPTLPKRPSGTLVARLQ